MHIFESRNFTQQLHEGGGITCQPTEGKFGTLDLEALERRVVRQHLGKLVHHQQRFYTALSQLGQSVQGLDRRK